MNVDHNNIDVYAEKYGGGLYWLASRRNCELLNGSDNLWLSKNFHIQVQMFFKAEPSKQIRILVPLDCLAKVVIKKHTSPIKGSEYLVFTGFIDFIFMPRTHG